MMGNKEDVRGICPGYFWLFLAIWQRWVAALPPATICTRLGFCNLAKMFLGLSEFFEVPTVIQKWTNASGEFCLRFQIETERQDTSAWLQFISQKRLKI